METHQSLYFTENRTVQFTLCLEAKINQSSPSFSPSGTWDHVTNESTTDEGFPEFETSPPAPVSLQVEPLLSSLSVMGCTSMESHIFAHTIFDDHNTKQPTYCAATASESLSGTHRVPVSTSETAALYLDKTCAPVAPLL